MTTVLPVLGRLERSKFSSIKRDSDNEDCTGNGYLKQRRLHDAFLTMRLRRIMSDDIAPTGDSPIVARPNLRPESVRAFLPIGVSPSNRRVRNA